MTTVDEIMKYTTIRFDSDVTAGLYLRISNKQPEGNPPAYLIQYEGNKATLRRVETADILEKVGTLIPIDKHPTHIINFDEVTLYAGPVEICRKPISEYLQDIFSAL